MAQHCCNNLESRMAQQFCSIHTPVMSQYGQNLLDISLLYTNADKARLQHRPFWLTTTLVQTSLFMTFTVPAVQCHLPVHICSNLLVHDLHCTSNLSSNLLVHDLHCTSCVVSPTSSYLFKPPCS